MRIEKWGFLLSYAVYLVFCIVFSFVSEDIDAINSMIFAITIASTAFSISDLLFTKIDIDKKERESLFGLYYLTGRAKDFYLNKIEVKYGQKAEKMVSMLMELFDKNEDEIVKFFEGNLSPQEKELFLNKVKAYSNDELTKFVISFSQTDNSDIKEMVSEHENKDINIYKLLNNQKTKELIYYKIASIIAVLGLVSLLIILTLRISAMSYINNTLTVIAFLSVIINLLLKDYYKANSLKKIEHQKKQLIKNLETHNLENKFEVINENILNLMDIYKKGTFDVIVTNPPYKKINTGIINEEEKKLISRHEVLANLDDYIRISTNLLKDRGEFYMVHRPDRLVDILDIMRKYKIEPKEIRFVYSYAWAPPKLVLIKGVKNAKPFLKFRENLYIYNDNGEYTDEIFKIYHKSKIVKE